MADRCTWAIGIAEGVMSSETIEPVGKARILLALLRSLRRDNGFRIESWRDVDALALTDPDAYDRLLRGYWLLSGGSSADARDAIQRALRGDVPSVQDLRNPAVADAFPSARNTVQRELRRLEQNRARTISIAAALLAVSRAQGRAA